MYKHLTRLLSTEMAFRLMMSNIRIIDRMPFARGMLKFFYRERKICSRNVFNIAFDNPVGLGPGIDRTGELYDTFHRYGFSFVETGPMDRQKILSGIKHIQTNKPEGIMGLCINKDHLETFSLAYDFADFFDIDLNEDEVVGTMGQILDTRLTYEEYKPVILRLSHYISKESLQTILDFCMLNGVDGIAVGKAENVKIVHDYTKGRFPIIGYGGIRSPQDAEAMLDAGASLVEVTTGLVLDGPSLVQKILRHLKSKQQI